MVMEILAAPLRRFMMAAATQAIFERFDEVDGSRTVREGYNEARE